MMSMAFFLIGLCLGGAASYLIHYSRLAELNAKLEEGGR